MRSRARLLQWPARIAGPPAVARGATAGRGAAAFTGVQDNTDVFFKAMQAVLGGAK